jgi:hypothetical protein
MIKLQYFMLTRNMDEHPFHKFDPYVGFPEVLELLLINLVLKLFLFSFLMTSFVVVAFLTI